MIGHFIEYLSKHVDDHAQKPNTYVFTNQILNININPCTDISLNKFSKHLEYIQVVRAL